MLTLDDMGEGGCQTKYDMLTQRFGHGAVLQILQF